MKDAMLILHFIGLAMGVGTSFAHAFLGNATTKMTPEETIKFRVHTLVLGKMGMIGLVLLVVSGLYLITPYWSTLASNPLLIVKLVLVLLLTVFILIINSLAQKALRGDAEVHLQKMGKFGKMTLLFSLAIVILAVLIFH